MTNVKITDRFILIENCDDEEIIINDNKDFDDPTVSEDITEFKNKILLVKNCPNLKTIKADSLNLIGLEIKKCPQLEYLSVYNNKIQEVDLTGLTKLKEVDLNANILESIKLRKCRRLEKLMLSNNKLTSLDLSSCKKLQVLYCSYNRKLKELKVIHSKKLKSLSCEHCHLSSLVCSNLKKLEYLTCFGNLFVIIKKDGKVEIIPGLVSLELNGCKALKFLDCAENNLEILLLNDYPKLEIVSCKSNKIKKLLIKDCPKIKLLEFSKQGSCFYSEKRRVLFRKDRIATIFFINDKCVDLEKVVLAEKAQAFFFLKDDINRIKFFDKEDFKYFPKLTSFGVGNIADDPAFEEYLDKKRQEEQRKNNFDEGCETDSKGNISASNYKIPERKDEITNHDLSQWNLTGKLVIDGWANLKSLNVGNNELNALVVSNCPKLKRLIYSHNKMPNEAEISGCDNLTTILKENYNGKVAWKEELSEEEKTRLENLKKTEEYNDQVYVIFQREEQGENIDLDELTQIVNEIDINVIDQEYKVKLLTLYNGKLQEKLNQFYKKQPKKQEPKPNYKKLYHDLLAKIKNGEITINNKNEITNSLLNKEKKEELYKLLAKQSTNQEKKQPTTNYSFIISISVLSVIGLALLAKILQDKIKRFLKKAKMDLIS